jgi:hypothetical protein
MTNTKMNEQEKMDKMDIDRLERYAKGKLLNRMENADINLQVVTKKIDRLWNETEIENRDKEFMDRIEHLEKCKTRREKKIRNAVREMSFMEVINKL